METQVQHWCPVCDQGWVAPVRIAPIDKTGWLCAECEAFWPVASARAIANQPFVQFGVWAREQGGEVVVER